MTMAHLAHVPTVKLGSQNIRFIYWNQADTVTVRKELVTVGNYGIMIQNVRSLTHIEYRCT